MEVVALHGFANTTAQWDAVAAALPATIRLRAVALPGHIEGGPVGPTWDATVAQLAEVVRPQAQPPVQLIVGYSLGARLTLGLLKAGHVEHAVLVSVNPGLQLESARTERRARDAEWAALLRTHGMAEFARTWQAQPLFTSQRQVATEQRNARTTQRLRHIPADLARAIECLGLAAMPDYRQVIAMHQHRLHLVVGELDQKFVALAHQLTTDNPELACTLIPSCGHDPTLESPTVLANIVARIATSLPHYGKR